MIEKVIALFVQLTSRGGKVESWLKFVVGWKLVALRGGRCRKRGNALYVLRKVLSFNLCSNLDSWLSSL